MVECVWCGEGRGLLDRLKWMECGHCGGDYHIRCCRRLVVGERNTRYCVSCWKAIELPEDLGDSTVVVVRRGASDWVRRRMLRRPPSP